MHKFFRNSFLYLAFILLITSINLNAQKPVKFFERVKFTAEDSLALVNEYGKNKTLIPQFALQTLIALSYFPELKTTHIRFIYKPAYSPLETKPTFPDVILKGEERSFIVTISDSTISKLAPILLQRMDFNA